MRIRRVAVRKHLADELREFFRADFAEAFETRDFRFAAEFLHRLGAQKLWRTARQVWNLDLFL